MPALKSPTMMSEVLSVLSDDGRNVHFFDGLTGAMLGGLFQNGSVTQANFIDMLDIVLVIVPRLSTVPCPLTVKSRSGQTISQTSQPLIPGNYDIYAPDGGRYYDGRKKKKKKKKPG